MIRCIASPCCSDSSASSPAITAAHPPMTPVHSAQMPAQCSDSRLKTAPAMSNSTAARSSAAGRSFRRACQRGASYMSESQVVHGGWIRGIVVKAFAALSSVHPGEHHALEEGRRRVALLAVLLEHDLRDVVGGVEPHEIEQRQRAHRIAAPELHGLVDVRDAADAA